MQFLCLKNNCFFFSMDGVGAVLVTALITLGCKAGQIPLGKSSRGSADDLGKVSLAANHLANDKIYGYGVGTSGGSGGDVVIVSNLSDRGEGSLRSYLENPNPLYIKFREGLTGVIYLASSIDMKSHKTVDGRGSDITLSPLNPDSPDTAIKISEQSNIIISDLRFVGRTEKWDKDLEGADGINIKNSSKIWIHHCHFKRWIDGGIDIVPGKNGGISSDISLTSNLFEEIYQGLLLTARRLTFARNHCLRVRTRCVKIIKGEVHSYNNILEDWGSDDIQYAKDNGQLLSEENIFLPKKSNRINREEKGNIQMLGGRYKGGTKVLKSSKVSKNLLKETRAAPVVRCLDDAKCWVNLERDLRSDAGKRVDSGAVTSEVKN